MTIITGELDGSYNNFVKNECKCDIFIDTALPLIVHVSYKKNIVMKKLYNQNKIILPKFR